MDDLIQPFIHVEWSLSTLPEEEVITPISLLDEAGRSKEPLKGWMVVYKEQAVEGKQRLLIHLPCSWSEDKIKRCCMEHVVGIYEILSLEESSY